MNKVFTRIAAFAIAITPAAVAAQNSNIPNFIDNTLGNIVGSLINFLVAVATLVFIYGIIQYIAAAGDSDKVKEARSYIVYSIVGLAAILGIWGLARFLVGGLVGNDTSIPTISN